MGYWDETDRILEENGGHNPFCSTCNSEMYAIDDHGRFGCNCQPFGPLPGMPIPQVPADRVLSDKEKTRISPINRLHHTPTVKEQKVLKRLIDGMLNVGDAVARKKSSKK